MSNNIKALRITDRKGVVVGTWKRGEIFVLPPSSRIVFNPSGIPMFQGKILNLSADVQGKLIASQRVAVES